MSDELINETEPTTEVPVAPVEEVLETVVEEKVEEPVKEEPKLEEPVKVAPKPVKEPKPAKQEAPAVAADAADTVAVFSTRNVSWNGVGKVVTGYNIVSKVQAEKWLTRNHVRLATPEEVAKGFGL